MSNTYLDKLTYCFQMVAPNVYMKLEIFIRKFQIQILEKITIYPLNLTEMH